MNLTQLLLILGARYKIALFTLVTTIAVAVAVSMILPKQYTATATLVIDVKSPDPIMGMMLPALVMPGYMATQVGVIESERVAQEVVKKLKLDQNPTVRDEWLMATQGEGQLNVWIAEILQKRLKVNPSREGSIISIEFKAKDPDFAAAVANAYAQAFIDTNIELKVDPARQYSVWFGQQSKLLRDNLERAQARLSDYQQTHGIVASDERLDSETARLSDLSAQLTIVQGQTTDARSKQRSGNAGESLPEVVGNPLIAQLKGQIALREAKLREMSGNLGQNHPLYQSGEAELAALKQKLDIETRHIISGFSASRTVGSSREAELKAAIAAQKKKLLRLKSQRDELAVLMRDVETAQKAYEAVSQKLNQVRLESQSTQTNISILTPASRPIVPSSPNIVLNTLIAIILGTVLEIGVSLAIEAMDRRIRSAEDLVEMLQVPVLGVIGPARGDRLALGYHRPALAVNRQLDVEV